MSLAYIGTELRSKKAVIWKERNRQDIMEDTNISRGIIQALGADQRNPDPFARIMLHMSVKMCLDIQLIRSPLKAQAIFRSRPVRVVQALQPPTQASSVQVRVAQRNLSSLVVGILAFLNAVGLGFITWRLSLVSSAAADLYSLIGSVGVGATISTYLSIYFKRLGAAWWLLFTLILQGIVGGILLARLS